MQKYHESVLNMTGTPAVGVSVLVSLLNGSVATIYSDNGVTETSNPLTTNSLGYFEFYAADGRYTLTISGSGIETINITDVLLEDPQDGSSMVIDGGSISNSALSEITIDGVDVDGADIAKYSRLSNSDGSGLVGFIQSGGGTVARTVQAKMREIVSAADFGSVVVDTDCTTAIQAAIDAVALAGGGVVMIPIAGTVLVTGITLRDYVTLQGIGKNVTKIKLLDAANAHVIQAGDFDTNADGVSKATPIGCRTGGLKRLTVDGNKANQSLAKHGLAYYGIDAQIEEVEFKNAKGINAVFESPGAAFSVVVGQNLQPSLRHIECHDGETGNFYFNGQSDANIVDLLLYETGGIGAGQYNARFGSKATGCRVFGMHCWGTSDYGVINEGDLNEFIGCHIESATVAKVWGKKRLTWTGGRVYEASAATSAKAFILLEDYNKIDTVCTNVNGGLVDFSAGGSAGGNSDIKILAYTSAGGATLYNGTAPTSSALNIRMFGGTVSSLHQTPYRQLASGGIDMGSSGVDRVNYLAMQGWAAGTVDGASNLPISTSLIVISPGAPINVTDITSSAGQQGVIQVTIRNSGAGAATFKHNISKLRNNGLTDKVLNQYESITYVHVSGAVWQQTAGK